MGTGERVTAEKGKTKAAVSPTEGSTSPLDPGETREGVFSLGQVRSLCVQAQSLSCVFVTPWTAAHQAPLSIEFSSQEYWSGFSFSIPRIFLTQESNLYVLRLLHWQVDSLPVSHLDRQRKVTLPWER